MENTRYDSKAIEKRVQEYWAKEKVPDKIVKFTDKNKFYLLDGPPYINGIPHVGHAKTTTFKDVWGKFKYMQGFSVWFQPGFDCGGLPIENKVEESLKIRQKSDIEKMGVSTFIEKCRSFAKGNEPIWLSFYKKLGAWRGWVKPYLTLENYYLESGWWTIKRWFEKGLLIEGEKPGFWCPHCETVLAGYEVTDSYKNLQDPSIFIKFPIKGKKSEYLLVFTTTPWTLPANVAVVVHPDEEYVKIKVKEETLIIAKKRLELLEELGIDYKILETMKGKELEGIAYEPVLDVPLQKELAKNGRAQRVYVSIPLLKKRVASKISTKKQTDSEDEFGHMVTMDVGTGLVHTAPGHGAEDNQLGKHYKLPEPSPVDEQGKLTKETGEFAGMFVKNADQKIIEKIEEKGLLFYHGTITHSYPLCWRCKSPLLYRMSRQWFLSMDALRERILKENKKINWLPAFCRDRFRNLIEEAPDWAVTRQRYWGIPLPIWSCKACKRKMVIGSIKELREKATSAVPEDIDIHKDTVDRIKIKCDCGKGMDREKDIMDVWVDSGISPWASLGYPYQNKELFKTLWTTDLIDESQDQIRGWFYSLMMCSMATFDQPAYKTVCLNGWVLDEKGEKMSKSLGNIIMAEDAYEELGSDPLRLYYCYDVAPWDTQKFSMKNAKELGRNLNVLWNIFNYFKTYSKFQNTRPKVLEIEDEWILSRLNTLIKTTTENMEKFYFHIAGRDIIDFIVNDFSRTYVKLVRDRDDDNVNYIFTQFFKITLRLMAPITPFISDFIFIDLFKSSVHLEDWPIADEHMIKEGLEKDMKIIDTLATEINAVRKAKNLKLRWPLAYLLIESNIENEAVKSVIERLANIIQAEFGKAHKGLDFEHGRFDLDETVAEEEALFRELTRAIQAKRKEVGLVIGHKIKLMIDDKDIIEKRADELKKKVDAKMVEYKKIDNPMGTIEFKDKKISFCFEK